MTDKNMLELEESIPSLTLTPELEETAPAEEAAPAVEPVFLDESAYNEAERKVINDFSQQIDITNSTMVLQYGSAAQKKLSDFSESALANVRTKDLGEVGDLVTAVLQVEYKCSILRCREGITMKSDTISCSHLCCDSIASKWDAVVARAADFLATICI